MTQLTWTCFFLILAPLGLCVYLKEETDKADHKEKTEDAYLKEYTNDNICCIPDQWEGVMYFGFGDAFLFSFSEPNTVFTFINGTIKISYDKTNKKIYMHILGVQLTPLLPHPERVEVVYLFDYVNRIQYEVEDQNCEKRSLDTDMTAECIPGDVLSKSVGTLGGTSIIYTYLYTKTSDFPYTASATVLPDEKIKTICTPIHVTLLKPYVETGSGVLFGVDILDVTLGIKDPSIFIPPKSCDDALQKDYGWRNNNTVNMLRASHLPPFGIPLRRCRTYRVNQEYSDWFILDMDVSIIADDVKSRTYRCKTYILNGGKKSFNAVKAIVYS